MRRHLHILGFLTIVSIALTACEKGEDIGLNNCNVSNPAEELVWLKDAIDEVKQDPYSYYAMAIYKRKTVFYYANCNPVVNYTSKVKNCHGDELGFTNDLSNKLSQIEILWQPEGFKCEF